MMITSDRPDVVDHAFDDTYPRPSRSGVMGHSWGAQAQDPTNPEVKKQISNLPNHPTGTKSRKKFGDFAYMASTTQGHKLLKSFEWSRSSASLQLLIWIILILSRGYFSHFRKVSG